MKQSSIRHFKAKGKVQNIMFRQSLVRGLEKRGLEGGASNCSRDRNTAYFCLKGDHDKIEKLIDFLKSGIKLNNWDCHIKEITELSIDKSLKNYEVTTENVNNFNWNPNIIMYL